MKINNATHLRTLDDYKDALLTLIDNSDRYLRIRSARLDPELFDNADCIDALSRFARSSRYAEIHILIDYPDLLLRNDHRIIHLYRRLSQKIRIKEFAGDKDNERETLVLSDNRGLMIKYHDMDNEGFLSLTDGVNSKRLVEDFIYDWQRASPARQLRAISI